MKCLLMIVMARLSDAGWKALFISHRSPASHDVSWPVPAGLEEVLLD